MTAQIATRGAHLGLDLRFDKVLTTNTRTGQRLIHFAGAGGRQREMVQRLHRAYLPDGLDIGDHDTLAGPATEVGLDRSRRTGGARRRRRSRHPPRPPAERQRRPFS